MSKRDGDNDYNKRNKNVGISRESGEQGKYGKMLRDRERQGNSNQEGGRGYRGRREGDRVRNKRQEEQSRKDRREEDARKEQAHQRRVQNLRDRRKTFQKYLNIAENSDNPFEDIDWEDKDLKSRDRRKLEDVLRRRGFSDREINKDQTGDISKSIKDKEKENRKDAGKALSHGAGAFLTGGATGLLALVGLVRTKLRIDKRDKDIQKLKKKKRRRRFLALMPTLSVLVFGVGVFWLLLMASGQFIGTMLSHPEAIKELHEAGLLGDAMTLGNVTEDVVVDGEVIVQGNKHAQPGCFEYNGVMYCGHCLTTEGGANATSRDNNTSQGTGRYEGSLSLPIFTPYIATSNYGMRIHPLTKVPRLHGGFDVVPQGDIDIIAAGGGVIHYMNDTCPPNSATYDTTCGNYLGNWVEILHEGDKDTDNYLTTRYAHLNEVYIKEGQTVSAGDRIGKMGHTGSSSGPHLHFEVHEGGHSEPKRDPRKYMKFGGIQKLTTDKVQKELEEGGD